MKENWNAMLKALPDAKTSNTQCSPFPPRRESTGLLSGSFPVVERKWREALAFFLTEKVPEFSTEQGAVFPPRRESTGLLSGSFPAMERERREALAFFLRKKVPEFSAEQGAIRNM